MNSLEASIAVTNRAKTLARLGGDEKLLVTLAGFFLEDAPAFMTQLGHAFDSGDFLTIAHRAHSLKGLSSTFEAIPFMTCAAEIEALARAEDLHHLSEAIPQLEIEFDRLVADLQSLMS